MNSKIITIISSMAMLLCAVAAVAGTVKDTGDPAERVCNPPSYTDLGNGIVRDNLTGLEWVQNANLMASRDPDFDKDGSASEGRVTWQHALDYVALLNTENYLGYSDWRLPTIEELASLVDAGTYAPAIDTTYFPDTVVGEYWSSISREPDGPVFGAWGVNFDNGGVYNYNGSPYNYVRAVREGQYGLSVDLVDNGDGTMTDVATGLMWQRCNYGQAWDGSVCAGDADTRTWQQAFDYIDLLNTENYLGYSDWRLPTRNELQSLLDYSLYEPATTFPDSVVQFYWSSTAAALNIDSAWTVSFISGYVDDFFNKDYSFYVRAVRGGPCGFFGDCTGDADCDDGLYCNGSAACIGGVCVAGPNPCAEGLACDEANDTCEDGPACEEDADCAEGFVCVGGECVAEGDCTLSISPAQVRSRRFLPHIMMLRISGGQGFDPRAELSLGAIRPLINIPIGTGSLLVVAIVPSGLESSAIAVSVGDCTGGIEIQ